MSKSIYSAVFVIPLSKTNFWKKRREDKVKKTQRGPDNTKISSMYIRKKGEKNDWNFFHIPGCAKPKARPFLFGLRPEHCAKKHYTTAVLDFYLGLIWKKNPGFLLWKNFRTGFFQSAKPKNENQRHGRIFELRLYHKNARSAIFMVVGLWIFVSGFFIINY